MSHRVPITIRLNRFEGPLDLLLYLIQSHELDISKISIGKITDQYLAYVRLMEDLDFDVASDFLVMAATLIQWKSKAILPQEIDPNALALGLGDDALTPEQLLRQLQEHQRFLQAGRELDALPLLGEDVQTRPNRKPGSFKIWKDLDATGLGLTFQDLLVREKRRTTILKKETVSLSDKIFDFQDRLEIGKLKQLRDLLRDRTSRPETVVTFLASLELGRLKKMKLFQEKTYDEIYLELLESLKNFDTRLASGFESIQDAVDQGIEEKHKLEREQAAADATSTAGDSTGTVGDPSPLHTAGSRSKFDLHSFGEESERPLGELLAGTLSAGTDRELGESEKPELGNSNPGIGITDGRGRGESTADSGVHPND